MYVCMYVCMYACMHICTYVSIYNYKYSIRVYACIYVETYCSMDKYFNNKSFIKNVTFININKKLRYITDLTFASIGFMCNLFGKCSQSISFLGLALMIAYGSIMQKNMDSMRNYVAIVLQKHSHASDGEILTAFMQIIFT